MNAILTKERRALRPAFAATIAGTVLTALLFNGSDASGIAITAYTIGVALLAASSFGNEFQTRTMLLMLMQPISREQMWREKMRELALELAVSFAVLLLSLLCFVRGEGHLQSFWQIAPAFAFIPLVVFCSTPYFTLATKNILVAIAITIGLPWGFTMVGMGIDWFFTWMLGRPKLFLEELGDAYPALFWSAVAMVALGYCTALYRLGHRAFMEYQVVDAQALEVALPPSVERRLAPWMLLFLPGYSGPFASLVRKEFRLHRVSYLIAGVTVIVSPLMAIVWLIHPSDILTGLMLTPIAVCAFVIPFVTAIVAVADERSFGVADWQLLQPVSACKQWAAKMLAAYVTCILLGIVFPAIMFAFGRWMLGLPIVRSDGDYFNIAAFFAIYLAVVGLWIFASSISTNAIRATVAGLGLLTACGVAIGGAWDYIGRLVEGWMDNGFINVRGLASSLHQWADAHHVMPVNVLTWMVLSVVALCLLIEIAVLNRFAYVNFRAGDLETRRIWAQMIIIVALSAIFSMIATSLILLANQISALWF